MGVLPLAAACASICSYGAVASYVIRQARLDSAACSGRDHTRYMYVIHFTSHTPTATRPYAHLRIRHTGRTICASALLLWGTVSATRPTLASNWKKGVPPAPAHTQREYQYVSQY
jgi:hypothetical protein